MAPPAQSLIVDSNDPSAHPTINAALDTARSGDRIIIRPGVYRQPIVIEKDVDLIGEGPLEEIRLLVSDHTPITIQTDICRIENVTIQHSGKQESFAMEITVGNSTIVGCDISSEGLACISIHGDASPTILCVRVHSSHETGVMISGQSRAILEGNMIFDNQFAGIEIRDDSNPTIKNNHIYGKNEVGILVHNHGLGTIIDNEIFSNRFSGIEVRSRANPQITNNHIHKNGRSGIFVHDFATGIIDGNTISKNGTSGIAIQNHSNPHINNNTIDKNVQAGIVISNDGKGTLSRNAILGNGFSGVEISKGGYPHIQDNQISWNGGGIMAHQKAGGVVSNNDLRYNTNGAFYISQDSSSELTRSGNIEWIEASFN